MGLGELLEDLEVEGDETGRAHLDHVVVEPQVVGSVGAHVLLLSVHIIVPHIFLYYY